MKKLVALVLAGATMLMTGCGSTQTEKQMLTKDRH